MDGIIPGSRGSLMLDVVAIAMIAILPILLFAIRAAKTKRYLTHKKVMIGLSSLLLIAVIAFEIEMRLVGWRHLAEPSPYFETIVPWSLGIHLLFSVTAAVSLLVTVFLAIKHFPSPPAPSAHSLIHRTMGRVSAISLAMTAITGWIFYWLAFVAS